MGNSSSRNIAPLPPLQPVPFPIGINGFYCQHQTEIGLRIRERKASFSGNDFAVKDAVTSQVMFKVQGTVFSIRGRKEIKDANGKDLFILRSQLISFAKTYKGEDPQTGKEIFQVRSKIFKIGTELAVTFDNLANKGEPLTLFLRGNIFHRKAEITLQSGQPIARISREFVNAGQVLFDRQTYVLTIAPGVDASLLLAICICLDEATHDNN